MVLFKYELFCNFKIIHKKKITMGICEMYSAGQNILQSHYLCIFGGRVPKTIYHTGKLSLNNYI